MANYHQNEISFSFFGMHFIFKGNKMIEKAPKILACVAVAIPVAAFGKRIGEECAKDFYAWAKGKLTKKSSSSSRLTPAVQTLSEVRTAVGKTNYDDGQLVGKLIYTGDIVILYGEFGTGKTCLALQLAESIATGKPSLIVDEDNGLHKSQHVFYYDGEMDDHDYQKIYGDYDVSTVKNFTLIRKFYFKDTKEWLDDLKSRLKNVTGDVTVFLDNISCVTSTTSGNTIREFFLNNIKQLQEDYRKMGEITLVFVAHTNKEGELAGTQNLSNFGTSVIGLVKSDADGLINMKVDKDRKYGDMQGKQYILQKKQTSEGHKYMEIVCETKPVVDDPYKDGKAFYDLRQEGMTDTEIAKQVGLSRETVNRKINDFLKSIGNK